MDSFSFVDDSIQLVCSGDKESAEGRSSPSASTHSGDTMEGRSSVERNGAVCPTADSKSHEAQIEADVEVHLSDAGSDELSRAHALSVGAIHKHYCNDLLEAANTLQSICNVQDTSIALVESKEKVIVELRESYQLEEILEEAQR